LSYRGCARPGRRVDNTFVLGKWASLHTGKYDANDTFGLAAFDSSTGTTGDWKR
jgi:hypothetical protein